MLVIRVLLLCLPLLLTACRQSWVNYDDGATTMRGIVPTNILRTGPALTEAFIAAFGRPAPFEAHINKGRPDWTYKLSPSALIIFDGYAYLMADAQNVEPGNPEESACHACPGGLMVSALKRDSRARYSALGYRFVEGGPGYGNAALWKLRTDLFDGPALLVENYYRAQGCQTESYDLYELNPRQMILRATVASEVSAPWQHGFGSAIEHGIQGISFTVHYTGQVKGTVHFIRSGEKYLPDKPESKLPSC